MSHEPDGLQRPAPQTPPAGGRRALLLVAGSGRSGTSLFTGLAGRLGWRIPQPEVVADTSNPHGFGEPRWAVDFHEHLLKTVDVTREDARPGAWDAAAKVADRGPARRRLADWLGEQLTGADRVVVKDPRLTWFLDLYRGVADELGVDLHVATMLRHPAASIKSREMAYGVGSTHATRTAGWMNMMLFTEHRTRGLHRSVIGYDELLTDWRGTFARAEEQLGLPLLEPAGEERLAAADALVDPSLRRAEPDWADLGLPADLQQLAEDAYSALGEVAVGSDTPVEKAQHRLDEVRAAYADYYANAESVARSSIAAARAKERRRVTRELEEARPSTGGRADRLRELSRAVARRAILRVRRTR